jgi:hypothetical protein
LYWHEELRIKVTKKNIKNRPVKNHTNLSPVNVQALSRGHVKRLLVLHLSKARKIQ